MEEALSIGISLLAGTLRLATPLILVALAGLFSERAGVIDIGLEGKMLMAAFAAAVAAIETGSAWLGLGMGIVAALAMSALHGFACISQRGNQVVSGMALNILVSGLTATVAISWYRMGAQTPPLPDSARFRPIVLPFSDQLADLPVLGPIWTGLISGHNLLVYAAIAAVPLSAFVLYRSRFGLRLRAVGENPHAVDTAGISVGRLRYQALMVNGLLCGAAGAYLSIAQSASFVRDMTAGKGYLALAAMIFGKWQPVPTLAACLLFAFADALQARLQGVNLPYVGVLPVQLIQAIPYVLTVLLLAGFVGRAIAPKAIGVPYVKEK
jgi:general nucleoside transport system permease protein